MLVRLALWHSAARAAGQWSIDSYKLVGLALAGTVNSVAWMLILTLGNYVFDLSLSAPFLLGVGLAVAALSSLSLVSVLLLGE
jgi:hypothetical protein